MIKKILIVLLLLIGVFSHTRAGIENYNIKVYDQETHFFGIFIYTIIQDEDGYLWIGTDEGLHQFDGKHLINLNEKDSTISNLVTTAVNIKNDGLLFGYFKGGVSLYRHGRYQKIFTENEVRNKIVKLKETAGNTYWALTQNEGMIRIKNGDYRLLERSLLKNKIAHDFEIYEDNMFVATNEGLIHYKILENDKLKLVSMVKGTEHIPINTLFTDHLRSRHSLWLGTEEHGLMQLDLNNSQLVAKKHELLTHMSILSIAEDDFDNLWVGTRLNGLIKVDFNANNDKRILFTHFNEENGFPANDIRRVFIDRENEIWVGTFGAGLVQITEKKIHHYDLDGSLRSGGINAITGLNPEKMLLATDNGLAYSFLTNQKDSLNFDYLPMLRGKQITSVYHSSKDYLWVGTNRDGLYKLDISLADIAKIDLGQLDGLEESVRFATEDHAGNIWVSLRGNGVIKINQDTNEITKYNTRNGFYHNEIFHIFPDSKGRIWFSAHSVGVALMSADGTIRYLTKENEIPVKDVNAVTEDTNGNIWLATYGQGVLKLKDNELTRYHHQSHGLLSDYCNSMAVDKDNNIWISHRKGVSLLEVNNERIETFTHKSEHGENEILINSTLTDSSGDIWFGTPFGLTKIDKPHLNFKVLNLNTLITNIRINYQNEDLKQYTQSDSLQGFIPHGLDFPHNKSDLTFDFIAIHLRDPEAVHYQFKLEGYDKNWSPVTQTNLATYTNLPPGKYKFTVKETDDPNRWKEKAASVSFMISPPYWETLRFTLIELFVMGIIIVASFLISKKTENRLITKILLFASMFTVFEYIHTQLEPYIDDVAGGPAIFQVLINLILALALFPVESFIKYFLKKMDKKQKLKKERKKMLET